MRQATICCMKCILSRRKEKFLLSESIAAEGELSDLEFFSSQLDFTGKKENPYPSHASDSVFHSSIFFSRVEFGSGGMLCVC